MKHVRKLSATNLACCVFLITVSEVCFSHDELADQVKAVTIQIQQHPGRAELYFQRAELYRADFHWKNAERDYLKAKQLAPKMAVTDLGLGLLYSSTNQPEQSRNALTRFLASQPDHAEARVALGHALNKLGNRAAAIQEYTKALRVHPDPEVYIERARLLAASKKIDQALESLDEGIHQLGSVVTLELYALELAIQLKRYDDALSRVEKIANQSDRKETWLAKKGEILKIASRNEEARKAYLAAQDAIQNLPPARRNNRYTLELEKNIQLQIQQLEQ